MQLSHEIPRNHPSPSQDHVYKQHLHSIHPDRVPTPQSRQFVPQLRPHLSHPVACSKSGTSPQHQALKLLPPLLGQQVLDRPWLYEMQSRKQRKLTNKRQTPRHHEPDASTTTTRDLLTKLTIHSISVPEHLHFKHNSDAP